MTVQNRKRRADYTGSCAQLPWTIRITNSSTPVENDQILTAARETRQDFYQSTFQVIDEISVALK